MDRNKPNISRPGKSKIGAQHHGNELFALGSKTTASTSNREENKSKVMSTIDRKREASSALTANVPKKPKIAISSGSSSIHSTAFVSSSSRTSDGASTSSTQNLEYWEQVAQECDGSELVQSVLTAIDRQDSDQVVALLCGAIKSITMRAKLDNSQTLSLLYLAKLRPSMFCNEVVTQALLSILRRDATPTFKTRNNPSAHILAANLLARGFHNKTQWPESFVRHYIDDAIDEFGLILMNVQLLWKTYVRLLAQKHHQNQCFNRKLVESVPFQRYSLNQINAKVGEN